MNRCFFGVLILVVFLMLGIFASVAMDNIHLPIAEKLKDASVLALGKTPQKGIALANSAFADWEKSWEITASMADHVPMDEIDSLFAQLKAFEKPEEAAHFSATCAQLSKLVEAMAEAHRLCWWSLL